MYTVNDIKKLHFEPSSLCNARCPVCPRYVMGGTKNTKFQEHAVSLKQFKDWFAPDFLKQLDSILMCGNYGDPGTTPDLVKIVNYINDCNPEIVLNITTNGGMRNETFWKDLGNALNKKSFVIFSIDGLEDTNHIYRRDVVWSRLEKNVTSFTSTGANARWEFLLFKHNEHQVEEARKVAEKWNFKNFKLKENPFGFQRNRTDQKTDTMLVFKKNGDLDYEIFPANTPDDVVNLSKNSLPNLNSNNITFDIPTEQPVSEFFEKLKETDISCQSKNQKEIYISSTGQVYPCCYLSGFWYFENYNWEHVQFRNMIKEDYDLLNLNNNGLDNILKNDFYQTKLEAGLEKGNCRTLGCAMFCSK